MAQRAISWWVLLTALALAPLSASAAPIWATWTLGSATTATASTPGGRSAASTCAVPSRQR